MLFSSPQDSLLAAHGMALLLGMRHGIDADHIAAIDAISRLNLLAGRPRLARLAGLMFSAGHAAVVALTALTIALLGEFALPAWIDRTGAWISLLLLLLMGGLNLRAAFSGTAPVAGLRARLIRTERLGLSPAGGWLVGALFALSFDTLTQATWFGITGRHGAGAWGALGLALAFGVGMAASDGLNGWWVARMLARAGGRVAAVRLGSLVVALVALTTAGFGIARTALPSFDHALEGVDWMLGLALAASALLAVTLVSRAAAGGAGAGRPFGR